MDPLNRLRDVIEKVLLRHVHASNGNGEIETQTVFDRCHDHYMLVNIGWTPRARVHGTLAHIDLIGEKIWVQADGTQAGLATELLEEGIPATQIVLGFRLPSIRPHTGFALA